MLQETSDFGMLTVLETVCMFAKCYGEARVPEELLNSSGSPRVLVRRSGRSLGDSDAARRRSRHHRQARAAVPRRTDHGLRSRSETTVLGSHQAAGHRRHHHRAHHPLLGGSRCAGRPRCGHYRRPGGRSGFAGTVDRTRELGGDGAVDGGRRAPRGGDDHPTELIRQRSRDGVELAQLTVTRPTLEDAYLHLIGLA